MFLNVPKVSAAQSWDHSPSWTYCSDISPSSSKRPCSHERTCQKAICFNFSLKLNWKPMCIPNFSQTSKWSFNFIARGKSQILSFSGHNQVWLGQNWSFCITHTRALTLDKKNPYSGEIIEHGFLEADRCYRSSYRKGKQGPWQDKISHHSLLLSLHHF